MKNEWWDVDEPTLKGMWSRMDQFESDLSEVKKNTAELVEIFNSMKGAWRVLSWIGHALKILGYIGSFILIVWGIVFAVKTGSPPTK